MEKSTYSANSAKRSFIDSVLRREERTLSAFSVREREGSTRGIIMQRKRLTKKIKAK
jgi:hypothetical protein